MGACGVVGAPQCAVANDFNGELTNLFRILQQHYPQLLQSMRYHIASSREFEILAGVRGECNVTL